MSKKEDFLEQVRQARIEHKKWVNQVRLIVSGLAKNKNTIALNPSDSKFGNWLYSKAIAYSIANSKLILGDIEVLFDSCYGEYHKIYSLLFKENENGLFTSLFGAKKASGSDYQIASQYYEVLLENSDKLLNKLLVFENQLNATNTEKFDRVLHEEKQTLKEKEVVEGTKEQRYYRGSLIED